MKRPPPAFLEEEVRRLNDELWTARNAVLEVLPDHLSQVLDRYYDCSTREGVFTWLDTAIDAVLGSAERKPARDMGEYSSSSDRAFCPLCRGSADTIYGEKGFAFPDGLDRHLRGSHNARQCVVMKVVTDLALDHVKENGPRVRPVK